MAELPVKPYEGTEPYIFISYSHRDSDRVFPILKHLAGKGYRLWYDEGIDPGSEWPEAIASHLAKCYLCIAFISRNSLNSQNCRREINFALNPQKKLRFLSVMLEEAEMTPGMELQLSTYQSILKYTHPSDEYFYDKLDHVEPLQPCNIHYVKPEEEPVSKDSGASVSGPDGSLPGPDDQTASSVRHESSKGPDERRPDASKKKPVPSEGKAAEETHTEGKKPFPKFLYAVIPAALAVVLAAILIPVLLNHSGNDKPTDADVFTTARPEESSTQKAETTEATNTEKETEPAEIVLSDDLNDYTFQLDAVYQLPCPFASLAKNGWIISSIGYSGESELAPGEPQSLKLVYEAVSIDVEVINTGTAPCAIKDSQVCAVRVQKNNLPEEGSFQIACGLSAYSSKEEVVAALGPVYKLSTGIGYQELSYGTSSRHRTVFMFHDDTPDYDAVWLYNDPVAPRKTVTELSDDLWDFSFLLDGTLYQLPFHYSQLAENGWVVTSKGVSAKTLVDGYDKTSFTMMKNGAAIEVQAFNTYGNLSPIADCMISQISVSMKSIPDPSLFQIAKGITVSASLKDLSDAFGEGTVNEFSDYKTVKYGDTAVNGALFQIYSQKTEYNKIQLAYGPEDLREYTMTVSDPPEYLNAYRAPSELGDDPLSGTVRVGGDLYQLPAPVSAFVEKGWEITDRPAFVASHKADSVQLRRDGLSLNLTVTNFSELQTMAENCAVTGILSREENGVTVELPKGLCLGAQEAVVKDLGVSFNVSDTTNQVNYSFFESATKKELTVRVLKETGTVDSITLRKNTWDY